MSAICGVNRDNQSLIERVVNEMFHRGPDQSGSYRDEHISLAHRRLSIIDLSENARQPLSNEDGTLRLVLDGEIYNYQALKSMLTAKGHIFKSNSDAEVVVHAYEEYAEECLSHLKGIFALALWDLKKRKLFIARDRLGVKPIYYYHKNGMFAFASEMKALMEIPEVERNLNRQAIFDYLGFEFVPAPQTMCQDVYKLAAGHYATLQENRLQLNNYWDLNFEPSNLSYGEAVEKTRAMLDESVKNQLVSDVPIGVFLSGGLDSSTLTAMMRKHISGPIKSFTIGYPDKSFSELDYAKTVSDIFAKEHNVLMIDDVANNIIEKVLWHLDEPMTDLSTVPFYLICGEAKKQVSVCLSGEGGDELFAGYDRFKASK
ncbi:MAG: asparagine synthase (glutamine-hydrolyzing), partial [Lentisphaerae bacterium]|nr:asparagine synthase (glutamine-hydrolyzing) [Lentisphaerota bacterium]